jgi:hypothetical protein
LLREFRLHAEYVTDHDQSGRLVGVQVSVQHNDYMMQYERELQPPCATRPHTRTRMTARHATYLRACCPFWPPSPAARC